MSQPKIKLTYFNAMGRAEPIRLAFAQAGVQYEDCRIEFADWPALKSTTPFGTLPVLQVNEKCLSGSLNILRLVSKKHGLAGKDDWEAALCDQYADGLNDFVDNTMKEWFVEKDPEKKKELWAKIEGEKLGPFFFFFEKFLTKNGTGYFVGDKLSFADLVLFHWFGFMNILAPSCVAKTPKLGEFLGRVAGLPNIKKWLETRPKTDN